MSEDSSSTPTDPEAARAIIAHQTQIIQQLNDEAVRIARLQAVAIGALVTGISVAVGAGVIEVGQFWPPGDLWDILGLIPLVLGIVTWGSEIILIPKSYSELKLGSVSAIDTDAVSTVEDDYTTCIEENDKTIHQTEKRVERLHQLFAVGAALFVLWLALLAF